MEWRKKISIDLERKSNQLDSVVKHYGQGKENPIDRKFNELTELYRNKVAGEKFDRVKSIEYIFSEVMENPEDFRNRRALARDYPRSGRPPIPMP